MARYTVLIVDDDADWRKLLSARLSTNSSFMVIGQASDGVEATKFIEDARPEIIMVDAVMPNVSGSDLISHIRKNIPEYNPVIYVITGYGTSEISKSLSKLNVDCFSLKPVEPDHIMDNLFKVIDQREISQIFSASGTVNRDKQEKFIMDLLRRVGAPVHLNSTFKSCRIILVYMKEYMDKGRTTKDLYSDVAKQLGATPGSIERNLRSTINQIYKSNTALFQQIFRHETQNKVTNMMFLRVIGMYISSLSEGGMDTFDKLFT